ncbi:transmembrane protein, putative (macronuclear) [Tetrahymena thermophila SB210]|uniref:Transmembrane protein, putative n=1 Tax=Tetrahymena thermophila (strain SB210) TaxID=312017 RepID=W7XGX9_TETTS|nr:transmembrane protein, putative [Tetrahymena thermophila SB210]EWS76313.1 transmembrane protein, putative [Tetrahymena thermophila SB210]|eukprot:XP_012651097.1 transmembrane protein, putative [Tetrahymena thermophila SB210]
MIQYINNLKNIKQFNEYIIQQIRKIKYKDYLALKICIKLIFLYHLSISIIDLVLITDLILIFTNIIQNITISSNKMQKYDQIILEKCQKSTHNYPFFCIEIGKANGQELSNFNSLKEAISNYPNQRYQSVLIKIDSSQWFSQNNFAEEINKNNSLANLELLFKEHKQFGEVEMNELGNQLNKCHNLKKLRINNEKNTYKHTYQLLKCYSITHLLINFQSGGYQALDIEEPFFQSLNNTYIEISKFQNLQELMFYQNNLGLIDTSIDQLGINLQSSKNLKKLILGLSFNKFGYQGISLLGKHISKMIQLEQLELRLEGNNISNDSISAIGQSLFNLTNLQSLSLLLYTNEINQHGINSLMESIQFLKLSHLSVSFSKNYIKDDGLNKFILYIRNFKELKSLHMRINQTQISELSLLNLIQQIQICKNIKVLEVQADNQYNDDQLIFQIQNLLQTLTQLINLDFFMNGVYKKSNKYLQKVIQKKLVRLVNIPQIVT